MDTAGHRFKIPNNQDLDLSVFICVHPWFEKWNLKKKKVAFSRRTWQIDPVPRVEQDL
jgi:hypothetical protein